jgi:adenosylcobinamide amidohydrolase
MKTASEPYHIEHTPEFVHVEFGAAHRVLSSAVLNGGWVQADHIVNLKVEKNRGGKKTFEPSEITLSRFCRKKGWQGVTVGMMTAATMDSFEQVRRAEQNVEVTALVTVGLSNAKRAGEPAEWRHVVNSPGTQGTINVIILTNAQLTDAAMVEAVVTVTEAKSAALQNLKVHSRTTGSQSTGTGTDAVAIVSGFGPTRIQHCGKHVLFGEMVATVVMQAITNAVIKGGIPRS